MKAQSQLFALMIVFTNLNFALSQIAFAPVVTYSKWAPAMAFRYPRAVATADVNGNGWQDLIIANAGANSVIVWTNKGNGIFSNYPPSAQTFGRSYPTALVVTNLINNGEVDIAYTDEPANTLTVLTNNGGGNFDVSQTLPTGAGPTWVIAADINHDGSPDLISANWMTASLSVFTNDGSGIFGSNAATYNISSADSVAAADMNGNGNVDLVAAGGSGVITVLTNNGGGIFGVSDTYTNGGYLRSVLAVDVNGNGAPDIVTANFTGNSLSVWTNNGSGILGSNATYTVGSGPYWVLSADMNGDGKPDLICANSDGTLSVLTNNGSGGFVVASSPHVGSAIEPALAAADLNNDGHVDLISVNNSSAQTGGGLSVLTAVPVLGSECSNSDLYLSWPSSWTNWTLQQNSDLATTNWISRIGVLDDGTNKQLAVPASAGNLFFRLIHP